MEQGILHGVMQKVCAYSELYDQESGTIKDPDKGQVLSAHGTTGEADEALRELVARKNRLVGGGYFGHQEAYHNELRNTYYYVHPVEVIPVLPLSMRPS